MRARGLGWFVVFSMAMSPLKAERTPGQSPTTRSPEFAVEEATIAGIHAAIAAGQVTCVQILQAHLRRIEAYDQVDVILYPHQRRLVVPIGEEQVERNGVLSNSTGFPAITFPGGAFDLEIRFDASRPIPGVGTGGGFPIQPAGPADPDALSIFTALEEQLGLKLEARTGPVEVLVIDHVEHPKPN